MEPVRTDGVEEMRARLLGRIDFLRGEFTLASGKKSDFYINGKTTTLRPEALNLAARIMLASLAGHAPDRVGGMTLGADALVGALVALSFDQGTPYTGFIVRKQVKGHGTGQWIEGPELQPGERVAVIEDVVTTGASALQAVERVRAAQPRCEVLGVWALVDRLDGGREALEREGLGLTSVFTRDELMRR